MTLFEIVALYVSINILLLLVLSIRVIRTRRREQIAILHGENSDLVKATRVHGNFTEYTPMALIGLLLMASLNASPLLLHGVGILLTFGRTIHAVGLSGSKGLSKGRVGGMLCTFAVLAIEAIYLLYSVIV